MSLHVDLGVVADALTKLHIPCAVFPGLPFSSHPNRIFAGRVRALTIETDCSQADDPNQPLSELVLTCQPSDVLVVDNRDASTGAYLGDITTLILGQAQFSGAIVLGATRDWMSIQAGNFPVLAGALNPLDVVGRGRVLVRDHSTPLPGIMWDSDTYVIAGVEGVIYFPASELTRVTEGVAQLSMQESILRTKAAKEADITVLAGLLRMHAGQESS